MIRLERYDAIAHLVLDMPDRGANVWNQESLDAVGQCIADYASDEALKGLVIRSAKSSFLAGGDLEQIEAIATGGRSAEELHARGGELAELLRRIETCGKPVVAAINGAALGGGYELCLACHHRVMADHPRAQVGLPETQLGLIPAGGGTQRLPRLVGVQTALGVLMEGKSFPAAKALKMGLVDQLCPPDQLIETAERWLADSPVSIQPWDQKGFKVPGGDMEGSAKNTMMVATAMFQAKTYGNYPAGTAILSCIAEGLRLPIDAAFEVEKRYFVSLLLDPVAGAMVRTLFLDLEAAKKGARRPKSVGDLPLDCIGVIGAGLMGGGIALEAARKGLEVIIIDRSVEEASKAHAYVQRFFDRRIKRRRATQEECDAVKARIKPSADYADLKTAQLVIEAVFEDRATKAKVSSAAERHTTDDAVIASNTSTLPITGLAEAVDKPEQFIGLHFFSPVERMALVEIIRGEKTDERTLALALDLVARLGKVPVVVNDARGFFTSRVFGTYITEGVGMLTEGIAPALIEQAGRMSGMPMPPLALADEVGLALMHQVGEQTKADLGDAYQANAATPVLNQLVVEAKRIGKSGGAGFYDYPSDGDKHLWTGLNERFELAADQPKVEHLIQRFLTTQALESVRCVEQGVMIEAADIDYAAIMGWGFAPYTGGPLTMIDNEGLPEFVARCDQLAARYGERFTPPQLLRDLAQSGQSLRG
jgi:3-hydroxyacyl-CoA dehydrogenase/enoyl-CoA hydratase/3-hydroxybutyryl-CoA epimerase